MITVNFYAVILILKCNDGPWRAQGRTGCSVDPIGHTALW